MSIERSPPGAAASLGAVFAVPEPRIAASYEHELVKHRGLENRLRAEIAQDEDLLRQKDQQIDQQVLLARGPITGC